jgi:hypothetical protein
MKDKCWLVVIFIIKLIISEWIAPAAALYVLDKVISLNKHRVKCQLFTTSSSRWCRSPPSRWTRQCPATWRPSRWLLCWIGSNLCFCRWVTRTATSTVGTGIDCGARPGPETSPCIVGVWAPTQTATGATDGQVIWEWEATTMSREQCLKVEFLKTQGLRSPLLPTFPVQRPGPRGRPAPTFSPVGRRLVSPRWRPSVPSWPRSWADWLPTFRCTATAS